MYSAENSGKFAHIEICALCSIAQLRTLSIDLEIEI